MRSAPANFSLSLLSPVMTGIAIHSSMNVRYTFSMRIVSSCASSCVVCAVCPSCHRNSSVRRKSRVRISHRTTFAHWLMRMGRSRYDCVHLANMW